MKNVKEMKINHKEVKKLNSFRGVELRGNETFDELLEIEKKNILKGVTICKAKNCDATLYKNQSQINPKYCWECVQKGGKMQTENKVFTDEEILKAFNNLKDIIESQKELNHIINKRLTNLEKFTLEKK